MLALIVIQIAMFAFSLWWLRREDAGDDRRGGGGGGPPSRPPERPPPGDEPVWWQEFESDFAAHVTRRAGRERVGTSRRPG